MDIKTYKEAAQLISSAQNILLIPHAKMDCDAMSGAVSLFLMFKKMGKNPTAICSDPVPEAFSFLPSTDIFTPEIPVSASKDLIISIDTTQKNCKNIEWKTQEGKINIFISPESEEFTPDDIQIKTLNIDPDLIISLDSGDLQQLGKVYEQNSELFSRVPFLNIDHHVSNTYFGTHNLVNIKNASTTEVIYDLIPYIENDTPLIDEDIATLLLAGMITDTGSFQHSNTTPKTLDTAAELIEKGARQQEIIKHLFKTKELSTLKLWGRILTKVQNDPIYRIVWSSVNKNDFSETDSNSDQVEGLIDELLSTTPGTEMVLLVKEREDEIITTSIRTSSGHVNAIEFVEPLGGGGHRQAAGFKIKNREGKSFDEILGEIILSAKNFQAKRLGIEPPQRILNTSFLKNENEAAIDSSMKSKSIIESISPLSENIISTPITEESPQVINNINLETNTVRNDNQINHELNPQIIETDNTIHTSISEYQNPQTIEENNMLIEESLEILKTNETEKIIQSQIQEIFETHNKNTTQEDQEKQTANQSNSQIYEEQIPPLEQGNKKDNILSELSDIHVQTSEIKAVEENIKTPNITTSTPPASDEFQRFLEQSIQEKKNKQSSESEESPFSTTESFLNQDPQISDEILKEMQIHTPKNEILEVMSYEHDDVVHEEHPIVETLMESIHFPEIENNTPETISTPSRIEERASEEIIHNEHQLRENPPLEESMHNIETQASNSETIKIPIIPTMNGNEVAHEEHTSTIPENINTESIHNPEQNLSSPISIPEDTNVEESKKEDIKNQKNQKENIFNMIFGPSKKSFNTNIPEQAFKNYTE